MYLKRARKTVAEMMRLQWTNDLDIETLEARGHWGTFHISESLVSVKRGHPLNPSYPYGSQADFTYRLAVSSQSSFTYLTPWYPLNPSYPYGLLAQLFFLQYGLKVYSLIWFISFD